MEDDYYLSGNSDDDVGSYPSDKEEESLDGLENNDCDDAQWISSKAPSCKVLAFEFRFMCESNGCPTFLQIKSFDFLIENSSDRMIYQLLIDCLLFLKIYSALMLFHFFEG